MADGSGLRRLRPCVEHIADLRLDDPELHCRAVDALFQEHGLLSKYALPAGFDRTAPVGRRWVRARSRLGLLVWRPADTRPGGGAQLPRGARRQRTRAAGGGADHAAGEQAARALAADVRTAGLSLRACGRGAVPLAPLPVRAAGPAGADVEPPPGGARPGPQAYGVASVPDPEDMDIWEDMSDVSSSRSGDLDLGAANADSDCAEAGTILFASPCNSTELATPKLELRPEIKAVDQAARPEPARVDGGAAAAAATCALKVAAAEGAREVAARKAAAACIAARLAAMGARSRVAAALAEGSTPPRRAGRRAATGKKLPPPAAGPRLALSAEAVPAAPAEIRRLAKAGDARVEVRGRGS